MSKIPKNELDRIVLTSHMRFFGVLNLAKPSPKISRLSRLASLVSRPK